MAESWKAEKSRSQLGHTTLIATSDEKCFKIAKTEVTEVEELTSSHEEADTWVVIYARHAAESSKGNNCFRGYRCFCDFP